MRLNTRTNLAHAQLAAKQRAIKTGKTQYVFATAIGYQVSSERLAWQVNYYAEPSGNEGLWEPHAKEGTPRGEIEKGCPYV